MKLSGRSTTYTAVACLCCLLLGISYQSCNSESYELTHVAVTSAAGCAGVKAVRVETQSGRIFGLAATESPGVFAANRAVPVVAFLVELTNNAVVSASDFEIRVGENALFGFRKIHALSVESLKDNHLPTGWSAGLRLESAAKSNSILPWPRAFLNWKGDLSLLKTSLITAIWLLMLLGWCAVAYFSVIRIGNNHLFVSGPSAQSGREICRYRWQFGILCLVVVAIRVTLVFSGGQNFFPDESRYSQTRLAAEALVSGQANEALRLMHSADHLLFRICALVPAVVEVCFFENPLVPALFFSIFGLLSMLLVHSITLQLTHCRTSSITACLCFAGSGSMAFFCRHLLPYDMALALGLAGLRASLISSWYRSALLTGVLAFLSFLTYNGYWLLSCVCIVAHMLANEGSLGTRLKRCLSSGTVFVGCFLFLLALDRYWVEQIRGPERATVDRVEELSLVVQYRRFSTTVTQGSFAEGWSLPIEYMLVADGVLLPAFFLCGLSFVYRNWDGVRSGRWAARQFKGTWLVLLLAVFVYLCLGLLSTGLQKFVVYGRLARQIVPLGCIFLGASVGPAVQRATISSWMLGGSSAAALGNLFLIVSPVFSLTTPGEFLKRTDVIRAQTLEGIGFQNLEYKFPASNYSFLKADRVIAEAPHLINFRPFHFEGFRPADRDLLKGNSVMCRVFLR